MCNKLPALYKEGHGHACEAACAHVRYIRASYLRKQKMTGATAKEISYYQIKIDAFNEALAYLENGLAIISPETRAECNQP